MKAHVFDSLFKPKLPGSGKVQLIVRIWIFQLYRVTPFGDSHPGGGPSGWYGQSDSEGCPGFSSARMTSGKDTPPDELPLDAK